MCWLTVTIFKSVSIATSHSMHDANASDNTHTWYWWWCMHMSHYELGLSDFSCLSYNGNVQFNSNGEIPGNDEKLEDPNIISN